MRTSGLVLVLSVLLLAACGGGGKPAAANGEASKPATTVLNDAVHAATNASSVHVGGSIVSSGTPATLDLSLVKGKGATGSMSTNGLAFKLVLIGTTAYIQGSDAFNQHFAGASFAQLLHGKWLQGSATSGKLHALVPLTNAAALFQAIVATHGKLANKGETTYKGQKVVEILDTSDNSKLYVAATGTPYPVAIAGGKASEQGAITFGSWNAAVSLNKPKNAIDISQLGG